MIKKSVKFLSNEKTIIAMKKIIFQKKVSILFLVFNTTIYWTCSAQKAELSPVMQRLVQRVNRMKQPTQTAAHLRVPEIQRLVDEKYKLAPYEGIINQVLDNGERFVNTHYEFFHAQNGVWQVFQDVFKKLYMIAVNPSVSENFYFFRYGLNDLYYSRYPTITAFLKDEISKEGIIDDMSEVSSRLLSVNIALFSNVKYVGESTWYYFTQAKSWVMPDRSIMNMIVQSFGYSTEFVDELMALSSLIETPEGRLFQILVPKNSADTFIYSAWSRGIPYNNDLIKHIVKQRQRNPRPKIKTIVNGYKIGWKNKEEATIKIVQNLLMGVQKGWYKISPVLNQFKKNAASLPYFDTRQERILITNDYLLNPASGIFMLRYSTVSAQRQQVYEKALSAVIDKMVLRGNNTPLAMSGNGLTLS